MKFGADPFEAVLESFENDDGESSPYLMLRDWISNTESGKGVLLVVPDHDPIKKRGIWLKVVFERQEEIEAFEANPRCNEELSAEFKRILSQIGSKVTADSVRVTYHAFFNEYRKRAGRLLSQADIIAIVKVCSAFGLQEIHTTFGGILFVFETDEQARLSSGSKALLACRNALESAFQKYDEFGYLKEEPFPISSYSLESLERENKGEWRYYYR